MVMLLVNCCDVGDKLCVGVVGELCVGVVGELCVVLVVNCVWCCW